MISRILPALFVFAVAIHSAVASAATARVFRGSAPALAHLYVGGGGLPAARYEVKNGVPSAQPDRQYRGVVPPYAADANGNFYASVEKRTLGFAVFPSTSNRASRSVQVPLYGRPFGVQATGMAVDASGNTYFSFNYSYSVFGAIPADGPLAQCFVQSYCTLVYGAAAHGFATPIAGVPNTVTYVQQITVPKPGVVYGISGFIGEACDSPIEVIRNVLRQPRLAAQICSNAITGPTNVAVDPSGQIYVTNALLSPSKPTIAVFPPDFRNGRTPLRVLSAPPGAWSGPSAVDSHYLYVAGSPGVLIYDRLAQRMAKPIATLTLPQIPDGVAVGP
jgi:hypothetical protein